LEALAGHASALLEVRGVSLRFGGIVALDGVSFSVPRAQVCGLIGPNGAGKTTTLRAVCQMVRTRGEIRFLGARIDGKPTEARVARGIGHVPDGRGTFTALSVEENLRLAAHTRKDREAVLSGPAADLRAYASVRRVYLGY